MKQNYEHLVGILLKVKVYAFKLTSILDLLEGLQRILRDLNQMGKNMQKYLLGWT